MTGAAQAQHYAISVVPAPIDFMPVKIALQ